MRIKKSSDGEDVDVEDESVSSVMQLHTSDTQLGERRTSAIQRDDNFGNFVMSHQLIVNDA